MKKNSLLLVSILICTHTFCQEGFYIKLEIDASRSFSKSTNSNITANSNADWILGISEGYDFKNHISVETGVLLHNPANRYYWDSYPEIKSGGGSTVTLGDAFINIPINIKSGLESFSIVPYIGITYSTSSVTNTPYNITYFTESYGSFEGIQVGDTVAYATSYRPIKNSILINAGASLE